MRTPVLPLRYFLLLFLILGGLMGILILGEFLASADIASFEIIIETPFSNPIIESIFDTLLIAIITLVLYTIGVYFIVRKIPDEVSRLTAVKIFSAILLSLGVLLVLMAWLRDPEQIVLVIGIIWGALLIALRDLIQNIVGSLVLLVTRMYRIGDRIQVKGVYGIVMDIGIFRTTLMKLDEDSGDYPTGRIATVPNGILFRETVTTSGATLSYAADEIRITFPLSADIQKTQDLLLDIVRRHTREIQQQAVQELERLGEEKFLPAFGAEPAVFVSIEKYQILMVVKYFTELSRRSEIKNQIVEEISRLGLGAVEK